MTTYNVYCIAWDKIFLWTISDPEDCYDLVRDSQEEDLKNMIGTYDLWDGDYGDREYVLKRETPNEVIVVDNEDGETVKFFTNWIV